MNLVGEKIDKSNLGQRGFNVEELYRNISRLNTVFCWGAHKWVGHKDKFLKFNVQGYLFKGHVYITLAYNDTFTVYFTTSHGTIKEVKEEVYIDMLIDTIDRVVETK